MSRFKSIRYWYTTVQNKRPSLALNITFTILLTLLILREV